MGKIDWDVVTNYTDVVTTTLKTVTFPKVQEQVYLRNQGNANITYTIGSQSGTLTPGQSVTVNQDVSSYTVQAVSGTHTFELRAKEKGTEIIETDNNLPSDVSGQLTSITSQLAEIATLVKTTDNSTAIQNAINNASNSKTFHFPDGTYVFKNITLPSGFKVTFSGGAIIQAPSDATSIDSFFKIVGNSDTSITDVQINGGTFDGKNLFDSTVTVDYADKIRVSNINSKNVLNGAVSVSNSSRVFVRDCLVDGAKYGVLFMHTNRSSVQGCYVKNLIRDGILVYSSSQYVEVVGNTVENYTTGLETGRAGIHAYGASDVTVTGNIVLTGNGDTEGIRFRDSNNFTCTGNEVISPGASGIAVVRIGDFVGLDGGYGTISSNTVINPKLRGISVPYIANKPVTVVGNTILNATSTNVNDPAVGILVSSPFSTISGNVIDGSQGDGIKVNGNDISVTGNVIHNVGTGTVGARAGISIVTATNINCTNNTITDDQATKTMQNGIRLYADSTANLENNLITGWASTQVRLDGKLLLKNSGRVIIPNAGTSAVVTHGLNAAPALVYLTSQSNELGNVYVSGITASQFTVNCTTAPTGGRYVTWKAEV